MDFPKYSSNNERPCCVHMDGREVRLDVAKGYKMRLERMLCELVAMDICGELDDSKFTASHRHILYSVRLLTSSGWNLKSLLKVINLPVL